MNMPIITLAAKAAPDVPKKTDKRLAFKAVQTLANVLDKAGVEDQGAVDALARLYQHTLPAKPAKIRNTWEWVCAALAGKKDARWYLHYVHVTPDVIEATDGHRLHHAPNTDGLEPGLYDRAGVITNDPVEAYPPTARVVNNAMDYGVPADRATHEPREYGEIVLLDVEGKYVLPGNQYDEAVALGRPSKITVPQRPNTGALLAFEDGRIAVIMPYRNDDKRKDQ